jgi:diadenosine tetraphosphate (Ap4A) HIT family hydrolase
MQAVDQFRTGADGMRLAFTTHDSAGERVISQLSFHILPGANFNRRSTREKCSRALSVIRTSRRAWRMELGYMALGRGLAVATRLPLRISDKRRLYRDDTVRHFPA